MKRKIFLILFMMIAGFVAIFTANSVSASSLQESVDNQETVTKVYFDSSSIGYEEVEKFRVIRDFANDINELWSSPIRKFYIPVFCENLHKDLYGVFIRLDKEDLEITYDYTIFNLDLNRYSDLKGYAYEQLTRETLLDLDYGYITIKVIEDKRKDFFTVKDELSQGISIHDEKITDISINDIFLLEDSCDTYRFSSEWEEAEEIREKYYDKLLQAVTLGIRTETKSQDAPGSSNPETPELINPDTPGSSNPTSNNQNEKVDWWKNYVDNWKNYEKWDWMQWLTIGLAGLILLSGIGALFGKKR